MDASLTCVGTATTVLRLGSFTLLIDPDFVLRGKLMHHGQLGATSSSSSVRLTGAPQRSDVQESLRQPDDTRQRRTKRTDDADVPAVPGLHGERSGAR
jgi:hypothetical protein